MPLNYLDNRLCYFYKAWVIRLCSSFFSRFVNFCVAYFCFQAQLCIVFLWCCSSSSWIDLLLLLFKFFYFIFICIFGLCFKFVVYIYILFGWLWFYNLIYLQFNMSLFLGVALLLTTYVWVSPTFGSKVACGWGRWWRESGEARRSSEKWREMKEWLMESHVTHENLRIYPSFSSFILHEVVFYAMTKYCHCHALLHYLRMAWDSWLWLWNPLTTKWIWMLSMKRVRVNVCQ